MPIKQYYRLSEISDKYDIFFTDLWGVIHDGVEAYPGVHKALADLKAAGKRIIFLSNAPRRSSKAVEGLRRLRVGDDMYESVVTSGEAVFEFLASQSPISLEIKGKKYIIIGPERDAGLLDGTSYEKVDKVQDADFMIVTGFDNDDSAIEEKQHYLDEAIKTNIPLICANPDFAIVRISGKRALCAGVIAKKYSEMGGKVMQFGKPYHHVYEMAMKLAGNIPKSRIAAIGDNTETDILGAMDFGIDSYLIPGGILGGQLGIKHGELPDPQKLKEMCKSSGIVPTGILPEFVF